MHGKFCTTIAKRVRFLSAIQWDLNFEYIGVSGRLFMLYALTLETSCIRSHWRVWRWPPRRRDTLNKCHNPYFSVFTSHHINQVSLRQNRWATIEIMHNFSNDVHWKLNETLKFVLATISWASAFRLNGRNFVWHMKYIHNYSHFSKQSNQIEFVVAKVWLTCFTYGLSFACSSRKNRMKRKTFRNSLQLDDT